MYARALHVGLQNRLPLLEQPSAEALFVFSTPQCAQVKDTDTTRAAYTHFREQ